MSATRPRKPETDFVVRLCGQGIRPWDIPFRSLATILRAVQRLVDQVADGDEGDVPAEPEAAAALHLLDVKARSASYAVAAPDHDAALRALHKLGESIGQPTSAAWTQSTLTSLEELSAVARNLQCEIEIRDRDAQGCVIAKICPSTFAEIRGAAYIEGQTSLSATVERVGGAVETHCGIRLPESPRKQVVCGVANTELARELGQYLYQTVILHGRAHWLRHDWTLIRLDIDSFEPPKRGSVRDALRRAHAAGGDAWDDIDDPDALISEMRGY